MKITKLTPNFEVMDVKNRLLIMKKTSGSN